MKIGFCFSNLLMGGAQTLIANLMNQTRKHHEVAFCVLSEKHADPLMVEMLKRVKQMSADDLLAWSDVIQLDGMNMKESKSIFKSKWKQTVQLVGSAKRKRTLFNRHLFSPHPVAVSKAVGKNLGRGHTVVYSGVDTNLFRPMDTEKIYDVLFLGRLRAIKNPGLFLDICEQGGFSFLIIGGTHNRTGNRMNAYEKRAREQAVEGRDLVTGFVSHYDVPALINQAKVGVVTSNTEALGFNCLEPMSCGVPVVGHAIDGILEAIGGECGLLVDADASASAYVEKIRAQLEETTSRFKARKRIEDQFSMIQMTDGYMKLYEQIYARKKR
jgi:glycosyltransferase involved in cell wall biosynthesis